MYVITPTCMYAYIRACIHAYVHASMLESFAFTCV